MKQRILHPSWISGMGLQITPNSRGQFWFSPYHAGQIKWKIETFETINADWLSKLDHTTVEVGYWSAWKPPEILNDILEKRKYWGIEVKPTPMFGGYGKRVRANWQPAP